MFVPNLQLGAYLVYFFCQLLIVTTISDTVSVYTMYIASGYNGTILAATWVVHPFIAIRNHVALRRTALKLFGMADAQKMASSNKITDAKSTAAAKTEAYFAQLAEILM